MYSIVLVLFFVSGLLAFVINSYIFGGEKATKNQFPFSVSLRKLENGIYVHDCGASIISDRFVLTAAHCYHSKLEIGDYRIAVGAHMRADQGVLYSIERFIIHPNYEALHKANDIALVQMNDPIRLNKNAKIIKIDRNFVGENQTAIAVGWGESDDKYTGLKFARMKTISNDECRRRSIAQAPIKDNITLCAYSGPGTGICKGDSGGALIHENRIIGISSWGLPCARGFPDGFTRISEFTTWIDGFIKLSLFMEFPDSNQCESRKTNLYYYWSK
ncbi:chymotrypsin-1-like [Sitodiplosis mosellana]|uniref:chymotrypsin-1-like n=1 Tax=Sitodiplosis mosellana TaxID=263140 RepID=UPI002444C7C9|nr:chymotrypsin-1-like [Sitodiplosis mosellana]